MSFRMPIITIPWELVIMSLRLCLLGFPTFELFPLQLINVRLGDTWRMCKYLVSCYIFTHKLKHPLMILDRNCNY
jgi:hypothetical protein